MAGADRRAASATVRRSPASGAGRQRDRRTCSRPPAARWLVPLALVGGLAIALVACCPATAAPPTAFTAQLRALGGGEAVARLADGHEVTLTGLSSVPSGRVYVTGHLLPDGRVAVSGVRPLPAGGTSGTS